VTEEQLRAELERLRAENATLHERLRALNHLRHDVMVSFKQVWDERDALLVEAKARLEGKTAP
jgi:hypothetical protein